MHRIFSILLFILTTNISFAGTIFLEAELSEEQQAEIYRKFGSYKCPKTGLTKFCRTESDNLCYLSLAANQKMILNIPLVLNIPSENAEFIGNALKKGLKLRALQIRLDASKIKCMEYAQEYSKSKDKDEELTIPERFLTMDDIMEFTQYMDRNNRPDIRKLHSLVTAEIINKIDFERSFWLNAIKLNSLGFIAFERGEIDMKKYDNVSYCPFNSGTDFSPLLGRLTQRRIDAAAKEDPIYFEFKEFRIKHYTFGDLYSFSHLIRLD